MHQYDGKKFLYINNYRINESKIQNPKYFSRNEQHLCNEEVLKINLSIFENISYGCLKLCIHYC